MKNNYLKHFLTVLLFLCTTTVVAYDFESGGIYYNITDDANRTVEVTFQGSTSYDYANEYTGSVVIPASVTYNGSTYSVTSIGESAFSGCENLKSIEIPNSVTSIESYAFSGCTELTSITIPNSVISIGDNAFENTAWYNSLPDGVVYAGKVLYKYKGVMPENTEIIVEDGIVYITERAFEDCVGLKSIVLPNGIKTIDYRVFYGCEGLESITIPNTVTTISNYAFYDCDRLEHIIIPESVTYLGAYAFGSCGLKSIVIPDGVKNIGKGAFYGCSNLISVETGNGVTSIGEYAFYNCLSLSRVLLGSNVERIRYCAFGGCSMLYSIVLPRSMKVIDDYAFVYSKNLIEIKSFILPEDLFEIGSNVFDSVNKELCVLYVPAGAKDFYAATGGWADFINIVEFDDKTSIDEVKDESECVKTVYDLQGRKVKNPGKGLYIIDGKKVLVN